MKQIKLIRNLYFKYKSYVEIAKELGLKKIYVSKIVLDNNYYNKRERYWRFLVNYAYNHKTSLDEMSKKTGVLRATLGRIKRKYKIETKIFNVGNKRITDEIELKMIQMYKDGSTSGEIAEYFKYKTRNTVLNVLEKHGISRRDARHTRRLDYSYFKKINSHEKAYILGLLYTDGYIYREYDGFAIQLTESDGYLLERVAKRFGPSATVIHINCDANRRNHPNAKDQKRMGVYSKELAEQVKKLGVIKRKSWNLDFPPGVLPNKYIYSFLRGVIDGDGSICFNETRRSCRIATKSKKFAYALKSAPIKETLSVYYRSDGMYSVEVSGGRKALISFFRKIYKNKTDLYLERKYAKVQDQISGL